MLQMGRDCVGISEKNTCAVREDHKLQRLFINANFGQNESICLILLGGGDPTKILYETVHTVDSTLRFSYMLKWYPI